MLPMMLPVSVAGRVDCSVRVHAKSETSLGENFILLAVRSTPAHLRLILSTRPSVCVRVSALRTQGRRVTLGSPRSSIR